MTRTDWARLATLALVSACGFGDERPPPGDVGTLDGPDRVLEWSVEPLYRIGGMDGEAWQSFGEIRALAFDATGRLYVLDAQANRVTIVDARGGLERVVGEAGQGPGELSAATSLGVTPDGRPAVFDGRHQALVLFDTSGVFTEQVAVDVRALGAPGPLLSFHPSGALLATLTPAVELGPDGPLRDPESVALLPLGSDEETRVLHRAWSAPITLEELGPMPEAPRVRVRLPPTIAFAPRLHAAPLPDGRVAVVDSFAYAVKLVSEGGTVTGVLRRPFEPNPVTAEVREAERARLRAVLEDEGAPKLVLNTAEGGVSAVPEAQARALEEARIAATAFHPLVPVVEALAVDGEGRIWVQRSGSRPGIDGPIDLITAEGGYLGSLPPGELRMPSAFGPGGLVAQVERDAFDVPTVRVGRLTVLLPPSERD